MHYPLVGERVWVSGCWDDFVVTAADYRTCVATLQFVRDRTREKRTPFVLLFRDRDLALKGITRTAGVVDIVRSSQLCVREVAVAVRDMREAIRAAFATIRRSQKLIAETDRTLRRWQLLGCKDEEEGSARVAEGT